MGPNLVRDERMCDACRDTTRPKITVRVNPELELTLCDDSISCLNDHDSWCNCEVVRKNNGS